MPGPAAHSIIPLGSPSKPPVDRTRRLFEIVAKKLAPAPFTHYGDLVDEAIALIEAGTRWRPTGVISVSRPEDLVWRLLRHHPVDGLWDVSDSPELDRASKTRRLLIAAAKAGIAAPDGEINSLPGVGLGSKPIRALARVAQEGSVAAFQALLDAGASPAFKHDGLDFISAIPLIRRDGAGPLMVAMAMRSQMERSIKSMTPTQNVGPRRAARREL